MQTGGLTFRKISSSGSRDQMVMYWENWQRESVHDKNNIEVSWRVV